MEHNEGTFIGCKEVELYYQSWRPADPKATLVIIHGLGEHSGRYQNIVNHLVPLGYAIYSMDNWGHGRSPGQPGHIDDWSVFREDVHAFLQFVRGQESPPTFVIKRQEVETVQSDNATRPFFLMGHSMGGCIVLNYALHHPENLTGVVASAPAVGRLTVPSFMVAASKLLNKIKPDLSVPTGLDAAGISRDTAVVEAYKNDPLVHGKGSPRWLLSFMETAAWTLAQAAGFQPPLLLIHGDADPIVNVEESRKFYAEVRNADKKLIIYEGGFHESHNDLHKAQMLADLTTWLEAHIS